MDSFYVDKKPKVDCSCQKLFFWLEKLDDRFTMSECQTALISNPKFANITFHAVANEAAWRNLDTFHEQKNVFSSTERYFQDNSEARGTEIILKRGIGFQDNKNLSSLLIFDGNI